MTRTTTVTPGTTPGGSSMAVLTNEERKEVTGQFMEQISDANESINDLRKPDIRAAVNGLDDWLEGMYRAPAALGAWNQAIPTPARGNLTDDQRNRLLSLVQAKRFETGKIGD